MATCSVGNRFSLICFFLAFFSLPAGAETFAGCAESRVYSVPQVEVQTIDIQVPAILLTQLERQQEKNIAAKSPKKDQWPDQKATRNLFPGFQLVKSIQTNTMEARMADNTNQGPKDWDKPGQKKPDQKKPDLNQDADQDSENP